MTFPELELTSWRRSVAELYAAVRAESDPQQGHVLWRAGRDQLFRNHPESALPPGDPLRRTGLAYWPYDPAVRFELSLLPPSEPKQLSLPTDDTVTSLQLVGCLELPSPFDATVDVWWL